MSAKCDELVRAEQRLEASEQVRESQLHVPPSSEVWVGCSSPGGAAATSAGSSPTLSSLWELSVWLV